APGGPERRRSQGQSQWYRSWWWQRRWPWCRSQGRPRREQPLVVADTDRQNLVDGEHHRDGAEVPHHAQSVVPGRDDGGDAALDTAFGALDGRPGVAQHLPDLRTGGHEARGRRVRGDRG